jgi:hypothetical protein
MTVKTLLIIGVASIGLLICTSSVSAQTYSWNGGGFAGYDRDGSFGNTIQFTAPASVSTINITASKPENGCATDIVDTYTVTSGPVLQVGEWIDVPVGAQPGLFKIIDLGTDTNGNSTLTLPALTCFATPQTGNATAGPGFTYFLYFDSGNGAGSTCDSSKSSATAGFLDSNGVLQSAPSATGTVTCSNTSTDGGYTVVTTGQFSGTASNGQAFTVSFTITNRNGRYGRYAQSAQWTVQ